MDDRSARLAALAAKAGRSKPPIYSCGHDQEAGGGGSRPTITFRNYVPKDPLLEVKSLGAASLDDDSGVVSSSKRQKRSTEKSTQKSALELALAKTSRESREAAGQNVGAGGWSTVTPMVTRKVNWDLKRDVQQKMDKLERRTQRTIVELLRERLEREARDGVHDEVEGNSDLD